MPPTEQHKRYKLSANEGQIKGRLENYIQRQAIFASEFSPANFRQRIFASEFSAATTQNTRSTERMFCRTGVLSRWRTHAHPRTHARGWLLAARSLTLADYKTGVV
jgi:hypothetical protein